MSVRAAGVLTRPHTRKRLGHNRVGDPRSPAIVAGGDSDAGDQLDNSCKKTCHAALEGSEICRKNLVSGNLDLTKDHLVETPGRNTSADRVELVWQRPEGVPV
jgi:hypothetical protein